MLELRQHVAVRETGAQRSIRQRLARYGLSDEALTMGLAHAANTPTDWDRLDSASATDKSSTAFGVC